jgi:imidazolonepropionase-like amidohydrolase
MPPGLATAAWYADNVGRLTAAAARTLLAARAAREDLFAGFTAERDMGTEGAGSADTAVRDAIDKGLIPGPRLRISGNAIDMLGGHEDANGFNPEQHPLPTSTSTAQTSSRFTRPAGTSDNCRRTVMRTSLRCRAIRSTILPWSNTWSSSSA